MAGSLYTMPIIVLNMGGEMTYILHQRLQAQAVQDEKARKVLQDVVRAMYSPIFIQELFKPQEMYSTSSTKQIFEKLAHSSIMRLNKSSMDKLYDLMCMGFKHQMVSCTSPQQYLQVTLNHLDSLKTLVKNDQVGELIQVAIDKAIETYSGLSTGQWLLLKQSVFRFFQGKRIKVSLFLQQHMQTPEGVLVISNGGRLPFGTEVPGTIRFFEGKEVVKRKTIEMRGIATCHESDDLMDSSLRLGMNMYSKDHPKDKDAAAPSAAAQEKTGSLSAASAAAMKAISAKGTSGHVGGPKQGITASSAKAELHMLADLLGISSSPSSAKGEAHTHEAKHFKINLFPDSGFDLKGGGDDGKDTGDGGSNFIMIDLDATADAKTLASYIEDLDLKDDVKASAKDADDEDDLLALMDSAK